MKKIIVRVVFTLLKQFFKEEVEDRYIRERLMEMSKHLRNVAKALLDRNKNNKAQLREIWEDARPDLVNWGLKETKEEIDKRVNDPVAQDRLKGYLTEIARKLNGNRKIDI